MVYSNAKCFVKHIQINIPYHYMNCNCNDEIPRYSDICLNIGFISNYSSISISVETNYYGRMKREYTVTIYSLKQLTILLLLYSPSNYSPHPETSQNQNLRRLSYYN